MGIDEILALILSDPSKALAVIESLKLSGKLSSSALAQISHAFKEAQNKRKYGFSPSKALGESLTKIDSTPNYVKLRKLIGKHPTLKLARIGLYLETLGGERAEELVNGIREEIVRNEGVRNIKIVSMGSAGILSDIIEMLEDLSQNSYSREELIKEYEYILRTYDDIVIFVASDVPEANIKLRIEMMMDKYPNTFLIVATGAAAKHTMHVMADMHKSNTIRNKGYLFFHPKTRTKGPHKEQYTWKFHRFV